MNLRILRDLVHFRDAAGASSRRSKEGGRQNGKSREQTAATVAMANACPIEILHNYCNQPFVVVWQTKMFCKLDSGARLFVWRFSGREGRGEAIIILLLL